MKDDKTDFLLQKEPPPSCPRSNVTCATVKQFTAFQTTRHQWPTKPILVWSKKLSRLLSGSYFGIFVAIQGLSRFVKDWNLYCSTEFFIKDASFDQVCEILKIGLWSKGGESIFVFLLRLIALVRCYAGTLVRCDRPMLKKHQHTHGVDIDWPSSRSFPVGWSLLMM